MNVQELNLTYHNFIMSAGMSGKTSCYLLLCHGVYSACYSLKSSGFVPTLLIHQLLHYYFCIQILLMLEILSSMKWDVTLFSWRWRLFTVPLIFAEPWYFRWPVWLITITKGELGRWNDSPSWAWRCLTSLLVRHLFFSLQNSPEYCQNLCCCYVWHLE